MAKPLRIALTKGRLEKDTVGLLEKMGYDCTAVREKGRRLILPIPDGNMEVVLAKAADVITYVEHGVCDMGVVVKCIATKYPNVARKFFESKGMDIDIVKIEGSVELAPLLDLADGIVDIVETGVTLRENGLEVVEDIVPISARLIVNTVSLKLRQKEIETLIQKIEGALKNDSNQNN